MGDRVKGLHNRPHISLSSSGATVSIAPEVTLSMPFEHARSVSDVPEVEDVRPPQDTCPMCARQLSSLLLLGLGSGLRIARVTQAVATVDMTYPIPLIMFQ